MSHADCLSPQDLTVGQSFNVVYELPPITVPGGWVFQFVDRTAGTRISTLKRELKEMQGDCLLAIVLYAPDVLGRPYYPHRFIVQIKEKPSEVSIESLRAALRVALEHAMLEMQQRLNRVTFISCDPNITYGRILTSSGRELVLAQRAPLSTTES